MIKLDKFINRSKDNIVEMFLDSDVRKSYMLPDFKNRDEAISLFERIQRMSLKDDRFVKCIYYDDGINESVAVGIINETDKDAEICD